MNNTYNFYIFKKTLRKYSRSVEKFLDKELSNKCHLGEVLRPNKLLEAMRYSIFNGGKRIRPFLVLEITNIFNKNLKNSALPVAAALECVHCYSLIHDDLPSMDNDNLRRGYPTLHKVFDEATAILAGNALLTIAFNILANYNFVSAKIKIEIILSLSRACGIGGMLGGQMLDLISKKLRIKEQTLIKLQSMKTGSLLRFACEAGSIIANASFEDRLKMSNFGNLLGIALQLSDDLIDYEGYSDNLEIKYFFNRKIIKSKLNIIIHKAYNILEPYGEKANILKTAVLFIKNKKC